MKKWLDFKGTRYSEKALNKLIEAGATEAVLLQLAGSIWAIPGKGFESDSSDNMVRVYGLPVSFIRNHAAGELFIMLPEEAAELDDIARGLT